MFVPFWAWVAKKFDKKMTLTFITLVQFSVLGLIFAAVERQALGMYVACIISAGTVMGGSSVVRFSMMADVADALQLLTRGHRDEAKIVALFDISSKLAASLLVALGFLFIDTAGFRADVVPQPEAARFAIRIFYSLVPSILALLSAIVIWALYPRFPSRALLPLFSFCVPFSKRNRRKKGILISKGLLGNQGTLSTARSMLRFWRS